MAIGDSIRRHPLLRLLVFYVGGIVLADKLYPYLVLWSECCLWGALVLLGVLLVVWQRKVLFGVVASALLLVLGMGNYVLARHGAEWQWPPTEILCEARVVAEPRARQRSVLCEVEVMAVRDSSAWHRVERKVFAYLEPSAEAKALNPGDVLCFEGKVRVPHNFSDSLTFDYARYVTMQGAAGTVYVPRERWRRVEEQMPTLRERLLRLRLQLLQHYEAADFDEEVMGVLAALTLGDKRGLSMGVRSVYNDAGASHVLALSGLHVGIIYGVFALGLNGILRRRSLQWLLELLTLTVLWLFALLVGMSASVVRAVTMCTLYALARWVADENSSPLHVLALTALLMLLVHPLYLFEVGFQLSFSAMVSILWVESHLERLFRRESNQAAWSGGTGENILRSLFGFVVGLLCMSLAAQLGTFPLVLHHFGTFPAYFLLTNLVVVPCLMAVLLLSLVWWALLLLGLPWALLGDLLQYIVVWLNRILSCIAQWPGSVLRVEHFSAFAVLCTYLFILFAGLFAIKKWPRGAILALASLLALLVSLC